MIEEVDEEYRSEEEDFSNIAVPQEISPGPDFEGLR